MSEGPEGLKDVGSVIPSVYYDLIARIGPGVPLVILLAWDSKNELSWLEDVLGSAGVILLVIMAGYLVGLLLTPASGVLCAIPILIIRQFMRRAIGLSDYRFWDILGVSGKISDRTDAVGLWNKDAGLTLAKMSAEAILCQNLLFGLLLAVLAHQLGFLGLSTLGSIATETKVLVAVLLVISVIHRNIVYLRRQAFYYDQAARFYTQLNGVAPVSPAPS
jgi:hypothetical protein